MLQTEGLEGGTAAEWHFFKSTGGFTCQSPDNPKKKQACCPALLQSPPQNTTISEFYSRGGSCVAGCATKMVLGFACHQVMRLTDNHVKQACAKVLSPAAFRFVGVTELWAESIALFHAVLGGATAPAELLNTRPGDPGANDNEPWAGAEPTIVAHPNEAADGQLYECARQRMLIDAVRLLPGPAWERLIRTPGPTYAFDEFTGRPLSLPVRDVT